MYHTLTYVINLWMSSFNHKLKRAYLLLNAWIDWFDYRITFKERERKIIVSRKNFLYIKNKKLGQI